MSSFFPWPWSLWKFFTYPLYIGNLVSQAYLRSDIISFVPKIVFIMIMTDVWIPHLCVHYETNTFHVQRNFEIEHHGLVSFGGLKALCASWSWKRRGCRNLDAWGHSVVYGALHGDALLSIIKYIWCVGLLCCSVMLGMCHDDLYFTCTVHKPMHLIIYDVC